MELVSRMMDGSMGFPAGAAPPEAAPEATIDHGERIKHLERVPIFEGLTEAELEAIAQITDVVTVPRGHVLTRAGDHGEQFFLIVDGSAIVDLGPDNRPRLGPGACFGEMSLLDGGPRSATIVADTELRLLVLGRDGFWRLLRRVPALAERLLVTLSQRVRQAERSFRA